MKDSTTSHEPGAGASVSVCPACGEPLSSESPQGLCATCLMLGALDPTLEGDIENAETVADTSRQAPPEIEAIRAAFPQFEVLELIGSGGMGSVYKVRQPKLDRFVALKILTAGDRDERFAERFQQEAMTLAKLNHPNIVTIHDYGESEGFYFLLMEYIEGLNLRQIMEAGRLAPAQALAIVPPICESLQYAHDLGVVHRDIKPDNILMDQAGRVKIADFGIARLLANPSTQTAGTAPESDDDASSLTREMILGTPNYMAPEQGTDPEAVDHRADIYSLGVVFYEMLTGERPGPTLTPPSERVEVDVRLDEVVLRALANQPDLRFQSAAEFTRTLAEVASNSSNPGDCEPEAQAPEPAEEISKRRPWITAGSVFLAVFALFAFRLGAIGILLMALAGAIVYAWHSKRPIPPGSVFSRTARALLAAVAVPVVYLAVMIPVNLVSTDMNRKEVLNELIPPEKRRFTVDDQTVIAVDDGLRTHYVLYFGKNIGSAAGMSQSGGSRSLQEWSRDGTLELPSGKRIEYSRESADLATLTVNGRNWDLREGAVFQIKADGEVIQHPIYPPLLREETVEKWLVSTWEGPAGADTEETQPGFIGAWNSFQDSTYIEFRADGTISIVPVRSAPAATGSWIEDPVSGKLMTRLRAHDDHVNVEMEVKMDGKDKASISLDGDAHVFTRLDSTLDAEKFLGTWINSFTNEEQGTISHYLLIRKKGGKGTYQSLEILNKKEIYCHESGEFEWRMIGDRMVEIFDVNKPEESSSVTYGNFVITPDKISYVALEDDGDKMEDVRVKAAELPEPPEGFRQVTPEEYWKAVENASAPPPTRGDSR